MWMRRLMLGLVALSLSATATWAQDTTSEDANTYTTEDGKITLTYPEDWLSNTNDSGSAYFANTEAALGHTFGQDLAEGEVQVSIYTGDIEELLFQSDLDPDATALDLLEFAIEASPEGDGLEFETPEAGDFKGYDAASVDLTADGFEGYALFIDFGDGYYAGLQAITAQGELARWRNKINALVESIEYNGEADEQPTGETLELTETYSAPEDRIISVNYPAGWAAQSSFPPGVDFGSTETALDLWLGDTFAPGDVHLSIAIGTPAEVFEQVPDGDSTPAELLDFALETDGDADSSIEFSEIEEITVGDLAAAQLSGIMETSALYVVVIDNEDGRVIAAQAQTAPEELEENTALLLAILETLEVTDAE